MKLNVTDEAVRCFAEEWGFREGEHIRIYVRYAGGGENPYALGIMSAKPIDAGLRATAGGMTFFMEEADVWFLENRDLTLDAQGEDIYFQLPE
ncbi:HesB/YadR/YfhF family protein [Paenibacillus sp. GYB003]|uniref:HesB/YadR/YfhF family protein n=1 Tax=Paenibacillus sp. GYB003 TaxID=2994392 RepID=UPI002F96ACF9